MTYATRKEGQFPSHQMRMPLLSMRLLKADVPSIWISVTYVTKIYDTAHELRRTIEGGLEKIKPPKGDIPAAGPQVKAEMAYRYSLSSALAGLSEQIGSRLSALAAGKTVELVTMSRQTKELVERAGKDKIRESIVAEANEAQNLYSD